MPGRSFSSNGYRYGFNGKEKDDEVKGSSNSIDFGARVYDNRLARFLSIDPLSCKYYDLSTFAYAADNPIKLIDLEGKTPGTGLIGDYPVAEGPKGQVMSINMDAWKTTSQFRTPITLPPDMNEAALRNAKYEPSSITFTYIDIGINAIIGCNKYGEHTPDPRTGWIVSYKGKVLGIIEVNSSGVAIQTSMSQNIDLANIVKAAWAGKEMTTPTSQQAWEAVAVGSDMQSQQMRPGNGPNLAAKPMPIVPEPVTTANINLKGVKAIDNYLKQFNAPENNIMIKRLNKIIEGTMEATEIDKNFYNHEIREMELRNQGMSYDQAHEQTLKEQGMYHKNYDERLYTKDALEAGNKAAKDALK